MSGPEYSHRLLFGSLFALAALAIARCLLAFWGLALFASVLFVLLQLATGEFCRLVGHIGAKQISGAAPLLIGGLFIISCNGFGVVCWPPIAAFCHFSLFLAILLFIARAMKTSDEPLIEIASLILGALYLALPLAAFYNLIDNCGFDYPLRQWWAIYAVAVTKMTDVGAWIFGKLWGRSSLGSLSPHKTIEGVWGGLFVGCVTGLALSVLYPRQELCWQALISWIPLHLSISGIAQIGDLLESLLKRAVKARHSGSLPGLGGILDLLDSLLLTAPFLYLWHCI